MKDLNKAEKILNLYDIFSKSKVFKKKHLNLIFAKKQIYINYKNVRIATIENDGKKFYIQYDLLLT